MGTAQKDFQAPTKLTIAKGKSVDNTAKEPQGTLAPWSKAYKGGAAPATAPNEAAPTATTQASSDSGK